MVRQIGRNRSPCVGDRETLLRRYKHTIQQQQKSRKKRSKNFKYEEDEDNDRKHDGLNPCKKMKKTDKDEDRLLHIENQHLRRKGQTSSCTSSSSSDSDTEEEDGAVSTSDDAIYARKLSPKPNLLQSIMRDKYAKLATPQLKEKNTNIELEVLGENNKWNKINLLGAAKQGEELKNKPTIDAKRLGFTGTSAASDVKGPMFKDLGGMGGVLEDLKMNVMVPHYHPQLPQHLGVKPTAGILLHGPPGCGKTRLAHAIANEAGFPFYKISAAEIVSGVAGGSEENIRELFLKAYRTAPSIVFIDEIDAIASKRENLQRQMEQRIVTQLMTCMDAPHISAQSENSSSESSDHGPGYVLVIAATNRPEAIDPAVRRRFDSEIVLSVPDENARVEILSVLTKNLKLEGSFNPMKIARLTSGFVGADLSALVNKAGNLAMKRIIDQRKADLTREYTYEEGTEPWWKQPWSLEEMEKLSIAMGDFEGAVKMVQPSSRREGFSSIPALKWEDVGGLESIREEFERSIIRAIKCPEAYMGYGVDQETGFLLWGPPGCGKTLIAKAVANEAGANFIHIKGPELLNKYVGESELAVRKLFSRARTCSPCVLFFDEVDALTTKRGREGGWVVERLLNTLLIELDGADERRGVFVIGATNRIEVMDPAVLRPGRFGKRLYVPLPSPNDRGLILKALARKKPVDASVDLSAVGKMEACKNFSGADLAALTNEAALAAMEEELSSSSGSGNCWARRINTTHYHQALTKVKPSVSEKQIQRYHHLEASLGS